MRCPYCRKNVVELSYHYGGDDCVGLLAAFGAVTPTGKIREKIARQRRNWYELEEAEKVARAAEKRVRARQRYWRKLHYAPRQRNIVT